MKHSLVYVKLYNNTKLADHRPCIINNNIVKNFKTDGIFDGCERHQGEFRTLQLSMIFMAGHGTLKVELNFKKVGLNFKENV